MGLSTQGKSVHEVLLVRQESEIRLIEVMRRCLSLKIKSDREYACSLQNIALVGLKIDRADELSGSQIFNAWKNFIEELENQSRLIRKKMEYLEKICGERMSHFIAEKRKLRKQYQDDHAKIASPFYQLTEDVVKKKSEYQKHLESYKQMRLRFEEHYIKSGRSGRKLDDVRDKYQKACRKLHLIHNEYVLLLHEATEVEKDYRTVLLPCLLANQQALQEQLNEQWKNLLIDVSKLVDFTTSDYSSIQEHINNTINAIVPANEYKDFLENYKSLPVIFRFDDNPINNDNVGKLQPNQLAVDNLTIEWLKQKVSDLEQSIRECQEGQQKFQNESNGKVSNISLNKSNLSLNGTNNINVNCTKDTKYKSLKCQERQMNKLIEIIKSSLNEVSLSELPSGCDDEDLPVEVEDSFKSNEASKTSPNNLSSIWHKSEDIMTLIKTPFKKKRRTFTGDEIRKRSASQTPTSTRAMSSRNSVSLLSVTPNRTLYEEEWFHGVLPREEVVRLLRNDGDFLVRETTRNDESQIVLSVCWNGHKHFIVQTTSEGYFRFEGPSFPTIQDLIVHQYQSEEVVTNRSGAILKTPIFKEKWELSNDDVILIEKIGRGNFGDVYKARLKATKKDVAVKTCKMTLPDEQKRKFLQEGRILKQYDHPNIVKLIGICVQKQPIMIVMELVKGGSLLMFIRKNAQTLELEQMMKMCKDISAGMRYLESKNCIHRDLAARNCLIGSENIVKISDFGMSREEEEYIVSDGMKQIPIKWTAPEALNFGKYNSLTDVWSFGILIWEIFSKGDIPYSGLSNSKAREKIDEGYRMPMPENTPPQMYDLMLRCWDENPDARPHFDEIYNILNAICLNND